MEAGLAPSPAYRDWQCGVATALREAIECPIGGTLRWEKDCLAEIVGAAGKRPEFAGAINGAPAKVTLESAVLHGNESQVSFRVGGRDQACELADLLVVASLTRRGQLVLQRVCFVQTKRAARQKASPDSVDVDPVQLALLSRFPNFGAGRSGVFRDQPKVEIRNTSGMLGAYGILTSPGDLTLMSARILGHLVGNRSSMAITELITPIVAETAARGGDDRPYAWFDPLRCSECRDFANQFARHFGPWPHRHGHRVSPAPSVLSCAGFEEFVAAWSTLALGEPWTVAGQSESEKALAEVIKTIALKASIKAGDLGHLRALMAKVPTEGPQEDGGSEEGGSSGVDGQDLHVLSLIAQLDQE